MRPKMRIGPRRGKSKGKVDTEKKGTGKKERKKEERRRWRTVSRRVGLANG